MKVELSQNNKGEYMLTLSVTDKGLNALEGSHFEKFVLTSFVKQVQDRGGLIEFGGASAIEKTTMGELRLDYTVTLKVKDEETIPEKPKKKRVLRAFQKEILINGR